MSNYSVKNKDDEVVFLTTSGLKAEFVAISLALSSLYSEPEVYSVYKEKKCINAFDGGNSFAAMQSKLRNLIYNRKITKQMSLVVNTLEDYSKVKFIQSQKSGNSSQVAFINTINKLYDFVEDNQKLGETNDKQQVNNTTGD